MLPYPVDFGYNESDYVVSPGYMSPEPPEDSPTQSFTNQELSSIIFLIVDAILISIKIFGIFEIILFHKMAYYVR